MPSIYSIIKKMPNQINPEHEFMNIPKVLKCQYNCRVLQDAIFSITNKNSFKTLNVTWKNGKSLIVEIEL
jgi:hypothetical protein